jgi:hypothetical protein
MKLTYAYIALSIVFAVISVASSPRFGCFNGVCADFRSINLGVLVYIVISLFFAILSLNRLLKAGKLKKVNSYNSNDLTNLDG